MSIWQQMLTAAGAGNESEVGCLMGPLLWSLRYPRNIVEKNDLSYDGPVAKAVLGFAARQSASDSEMIFSNGDDLVDSIIDEILAKVKRTADLVLFCRQHPELGTHQVVKEFPGWASLKRSDEDLAVYVLSHLASMGLLGIPLPTDSVAVSEAVGYQIDKPYGFDERGLIKKWDVGHSWKSFKEKQRLTDEHFGISFTASDEDSTFGETIDPGLVHESVFADFRGPFEEELNTTISDLLHNLPQELEAALARLNQRKPAWGYPPIAWHNVWWEICERFDGFLLRLRCDPPRCETDQLLADHIGKLFTIYSGVNRLSVQRRRTNLLEECNKIILQKAERCLVI